MEGKEFEGVNYIWQAIMKNKKVSFGLTINLFSQKNEKIKNVILSW